MTQDSCKNVLTLIAEERYAEATQTLASAATFATGEFSQENAAEVLRLTEAALVEIRARRAHYENEFQQLANLRSYLVADDLSHCLDLVG